MSDPEITFGRAAADCPSSAALLQLESAEGRSARFESIDVTLTGLVARCVRGDRVIRIVRHDRKDGIEIVGIPNELRDALADAFRLESQQSRGAWFLPEVAPVKVGVVNFAGHFREHPRYAHSIAAEERGTIALTGSPEAMLFWSALEPMFAALLQPIFLRSEKSGLLARDEFATAWQAVENLFEDLGLGLDESLRAFGWANEWAGRTAEQQIAAKTALLASLVDRMDVDVVRRYRAHATRALIAQYYAKAKKGRAKRRQVVTKEYWRTLAAFFGGDWLAFIEYLGEQPHDEERVVTALPETKIIVGGAERAVALATKRGIPLEEVERMLGAYWDKSGGESPVRKRARALSQMWREVDAIHARQQPGMPSLWGLVQEGGWGDLEPQPWTPYQPELFRKLMSPQLLADIQELWGTTVLAKWPDRIVSEPFPHSVMASALGPALKFWHGCSLTAWFVCEGPRSRTDIPGLAHYFRRELAELEEMGFAVHSQLFDELNNVDLGPEQQLSSQSDPIDVGHGLSISVRTSSGSRRDGFVALRDVITRHRRWWTQNVFDQYLRARWEILLRATGRQFHLITEEKGKPPTLKQFAKHAIPPTQSWFGGDVRLLYAALGQKLTTSVEARRFMPSDTIRFASSVFENLGGTSVDQTDRSGHERNHKLRRLASESLSYVQLLEALGRPPTLKEFGSKFEWMGPALATNIDDAWLLFARAIDGSLEHAR